MAKLSGQTKLTKAGSTLGTVAYMSPEQVQGEKVDYRSDIWSFGVLLFEMLTGQSPFTEDVDQAVMYGIVNGDHESITGLRTGVPLKLEQIVNKCLAKEADERYQHIDEILVDLKSLHKELVSGKRKARSWKKKTVVRNRVYFFGSVAIFIILVLAVLFFLLPSESVSRKSVAVLCFDNLSPDPENEYFSDGVSEEIRTLLAKVADLTVISRTAVIGYKNSDKDIQEIGKELRIDAILDGSVRWEGNQVRIVCQLVDARTAQSIWAEDYDRELKNIFDVQSSVAKQVVAALKAELSPKERNRIEKKPTENLQAYQYLLRGRVLHLRLTKKDNEKAIEFFKKAITLDSNSALAYAYLANGFLWRVGFGFAEAWRDSAFENSQKAIALDPEVAMSYEVLSRVYNFKGEDHNKVLELMHKAVELEPNNTSTLNNIGATLRNQGELDQAIPWFKRALAINLSINIPKVNLAGLYRWLGDDSVAMTWINEILDLNTESRPGIRALGALYLCQRNYKLTFEQGVKLLTEIPGSLDGLYLAGVAEMLMGNYTEARKYFEQKIVLSQREELDTNLRLGYTLWKMDERNEAQKILSQVLRGTLKAVEEGKREFFSYQHPLRIAAVHAIQNDRKEALDWLKKAVDDGGWLAYYDRMIMPWWDPYRDDPRFKQLMTRMTTQIAEMREKVKKVEMNEW